jgi:bifunctional DNA-binding transcriptional regulator/antitoxin component of YhaV-PrlF toxin-antitoxin module
MIKKSIQSFIEYGVKFTEEECEKLGINEGDKFSIETLEDGIVLKKYESLELNLDEFSRENLEFLIKESCDKDITISQVIENIIESFVKNETNI